ncbi:post-GPI attachment to proteins factor 6 [Onthophagus taurus]|uniref:post-GPI attachment to proteins factor 6 n=1 Tax=Onthophagus taurus TaxID=166361 RepID=UPI000C1FE3A9|nr:uncharacterized protein LOC111421724 isoform X1 [Onthophagus taurus]XP_022910674.1 uncharacterized protein LOC111421724 isoform X2 [Onthophagus taurus]
MNFKYFMLFLLSLTTKVASEDQLYLLKSVRTDYLEDYEGYAFISLIHFSVPSDTVFASFRFQAEQTSFSIFGCNSDEIILYMKHGSIPVINPDNSKLPQGFFNATTSKLMYLDFSSDKKYHYINITTPTPGSYYATAFHPYNDPDHEAITQSGLSQFCRTYVDASLFIKKSFVLNVGTSGVSMDMRLSQNETQTYKFFIPNGNNRLVLVLSNIEFCADCTELSAKIYSDVDNLNSQGLISISKATHKNEPIYYRLNTIENTWQYIQFNITSKNIHQEKQGKLKMQIKSFETSNANIAQENYYELFKTKNLSDLFGDPMYKLLSNELSTNRVLYKEYDLVRSGKAETFFYQFDLHPNPDGSIPISVNLTSEDYTTLRFRLDEAVDTGGTLSFIIAFAPRITKSGRSIIRTPEPTSHRVVACIRNSFVQVPTYPDKCVDGFLTSDSPLVLNSTITNISAMLPYPDSGVWYVTLKLFCGECEKCTCSEDCLKMYQNCVEACENKCKTEDCTSCGETCHVKLKRDNSNCTSDCNCDGSCKKTETSCKTGVIFDISSYPCVPGECANNGKCLFMVSEGIVFSTCLCANKYKGYDCSDGSRATPYGMLVLEMTLLVISNVAFIPAAYIAYKRQYYVEAIVYFSTFFFSSLYHACDAGERIISFCIVRLGVLQFSDFFSGLLSIWVTLIAMAYLPQPYVSIAHMAGCIVLSFGTTFDKTSLWVFVIPSAIGVGILIGNWYYLSKKNKCLFPKKRYLKIYLPIGSTIVIVALLVYALFQTQSNYKYLHSLWHFLMAVGVICLLPDEKNFLPDNVHSNLGLDTHSE